MDRLTDEVDDNNKINVLCFRHDKNMVEAGIIAAVDMFDETVVDGMALQIGRWHGFDVRPDVNNVGGGFGDVLHFGAERRLELLLAQLSGQLFPLYAPRGKPGLANRTGP